MSDVDDNKNIQKLLQIRLLYFLFTIPHEVVVKDFAYFLRTAKLTLSPRMPHICAFLDYFSFSHFLAISSRF